MGKSSSSLVKMKVPSTFYFYFLAVLITVEGSSSKEGLPKSTVNPNAYNVVALKELLERPDAYKQRLLSDYKPPILTSHDESLKGNYKRNAQNTRRNGNLPNHGVNTTGSSESLELSDNAPYYGPQPGGETKRQLSSRLIPPNELIRLSGSENMLECTKEGELHNVWSNMYDCLVCVCIQDAHYLRPVCVNCGGCMKKPQDKPQPEKPKVTCAPFPVNRPFEDPLNPCQVCICKEVQLGSGHHEVIIICDDNPECIIPPTQKPTTQRPTRPTRPTPPPTTRPTLPPWSPVPQHTTAGPTTLYPPYTTPTTVAPTTQNPDKHVLGPFPHVSCKPFLPGVPFDHPWDPCLICVCEEYFSPGIINIEVDCYMRPECCYLPGDPNNPILIPEGLRPGSVGSSNLNLKATPYKGQHNNNDKHYKRPIDGTLFFSDDGQNYHLPTGGKVHHGDANILINPEKPNNNHGQNYHLPTGGKAHPGETEDINLDPKYYNDEYKY